MDERIRNETDSPTSAESLEQQQQEEEDEDPSRSGRVDEVLNHHPLGEIEEKGIISTFNDIGSNLDGECPLSTSSSSEERTLQNTASSEEEKVDRGDKTSRKKNGSFVPRTMFDFDPAPPSPPNNHTEKKKNKKKKARRPKEAVPSESSVQPQAVSSIFSQTTMKYLKSSGLHSKRMENLLMKYLGPTTLSSQQDSV